LPIRHPRNQTISRRGRVSDFWLPTPARKNEGASGDMYEKKGIGKMEAPNPE
jgi:hypothetical protein